MLGIGNCSHLPLNSGMAGEVMGDGRTHLHLDNSVTNYRGHNTCRSYITLDKMLVKKKKAHVKQCKSILSRDLVSNKCPVRN